MQKAAAQKPEKEKPAAKKTVLQQICKKYDVTKEHGTVPGPADVDSQKDRHK